MLVFRLLVTTLTAFLVLTGVSPAEDAVTSKASQPAFGYWTPERMRDAIRNSPSGSRASAAAAGGASPAPALPGTRAVGRVFSVKPNGQTYACSGTLVTSRNKSLVWTAGHCIHRGRRGRFHSNVSFVPSYQAQATGNPAPFGAWQASWLGVPRAWERRGAADSRRRYRPDADAGAVVLTRDTQGRTLTDVLGVSQPISFSRDVRRRVRLIGYPGAAPYMGEQMMQCGPRRVRRLRRSALLGMPCPLGAGMSGGPALVGMNALGVGTVVGAITSNAHGRAYFAANPRYFRNLYREFSSQGS